MAINKLNWLVSLRLRLFLCRSKVGEVFAEDFFFDFVPLGLFFLEGSVEAEDVELEFFHEFIVQRNVVSDLVLLLNQVQFGCDAGIVFEVLFSDLKQFFDRVLNSALDLPIMQDVSESLKDSIDTSRCSFPEYLSTVDEKFGRQFNRVLSWFLQEKCEYLQSKQLVDHLLINEVRNEFETRFASVFVVATVGFLELDNDSVDN